MIPIASKARCPDQIFPFLDRDKVLTPPPCFSQSAEPQVMDIKRVYDLCTMRDHRIGHSRFQFATHIVPYHLSILSRSVFLIFFHHATLKRQEMGSKKSLYTDKTAVSSNTSLSSSSSSSSDSSDSTMLHPYVLPHPYFSRSGLLRTLRDRYPEENFRVQLRLNQWTIFTPKALSEQEMAAICRIR
ncbi:hypothetical protein L207DRAFT_507544 [Hyaloscypha variabilis F]|uniref:Uncharacterized protein n=1 Tax=Hyaloscypha variabilis (strain UAMH 11265 / GT02V1 / F) TaxID=1149755 RepID=A0A2J6S7C9_HYAVF|nr:hypothetical protein L207DRAFT_507544 [Hyaloscypha variabilis F]